MVGVERWVKMECRWLREQGSDGRGASDKGSARKRGERGDGRLDEASSRGEEAGWGERERERV